MKTTRYLAVLLLAAAALLASPMAAQADPSCPAGTACFWQNRDFQGLKRVAGNDAEGVWRLLNIEGVNFQSLKNHFDRRAIWTRHNNGTATCTNPGIHRNNAPVFNQVYVGGVGSRC